MLVIVLLASMILLLSIQTIKESYLNNFRQNLEDINITVQPTILSLLEREDSAYLQEYVVNLGSRLNARITIIDLNGKVIADTQVEPSYLDNHAGRPEVASAIKGQKKSSIRYSISVNSDMLYVAMPLIADDEIIGVCRVSVLLSDINFLLDDLTIDIVQIAFVVVLLSLIGVLFFTQNITKPIKELSSASMKVASGDFSIQIDNKGKDEISDLTKNFNEMVYQLNESFKVVTSQKEEYYTLISSIQEGLLVLNSNGIIIMSNKSFNEIIGFNSIISEHYSDVLPKEEFKEIFKLIKKKKKAVTRELFFNEEMYSVSLSYIETKDEYVVLFQNISERKRLEKIKQDLVINVSHELRTPLTAIKGFVETLQDEETDAENQHYLEIIMRHTNRLINIVQDLLILSELENENSRLLLSKVDLKVLCDNVIKIFEQKVKAKNLQLVSIYDDDLPLAKVDNFRIEQVIINLIDNALKYTDRGKIEINIQQEFDKIVIEVSDTGQGIDKKDLKHIFDRFYKVDKARSAKVQSSGLGLSIVKHIVQLHEGTLNVESNKGIGTKFTIHLPIKGPSGKK